MSSIFIGPREKKVLRVLARSNVGSVHELAQRATRSRLCPERDVYTLRIYSAACEWMAMAGYVEFRWLFGRSEIGLSRAGVKKARELGLAGYVQKKEEAYRSPVAAGLGALALAGCSVLAPGASVAPASVETYAPTPIATGKVTQIATKTNGA